MLLFFFMILSRPHDKLFAGKLELKNLHYAENSKRICQVFLYTYFKSEKQEMAGDVRQYSVLPKHDKKIIKNKIK